MSRDSFNEATISGVRWVMLGRAVSETLALVCIVVLARLVSPADFGHAAVALIFVPLAGILTFEGFASALVQRETIEESHRQVAIADEPDGGRDPDAARAGAGSDRVAADLRRADRRPDRAGVAGLPDRLAGHRLARDAVAPSGLPADEPDRSHGDDGWQPGAGGSRARRAWERRLSWWGARADAAHLGAAVRGRTIATAPLALALAAGDRRLRDRRSARGVGGRDVPQRRLRDPRRAAAGGAGGHLLALVQPRRGVPGQVEQRDDAAGVPGLLPHREPRGDARAARARQPRARRRDLPAARVADRARATADPVRARPRVDAGGAPGADPGAGGNGRRDPHRLPAGDARRGPPAGAAATSTS